MTENKTIGIAMSGGGHRATIFALGALLYLVDCGRNKDTTIISSVSGGSLTNAFLALLPSYCEGKSFREVDSKTFDQAVALLAKQIAGNPCWWYISVVSYVFILIIWMAITIYEFPNNLVWEWQLPFPAIIGLWAYFIGPRSGGTLWASWITWLYVGLMVFGLTFGIAFWCHSPSKIAGLMLCVTSILVFGVRGRVSELAMGKVFSTLKNYQDALCAAKLEKELGQRQRPESPLENIHKPLETVDSDLLLSDISRSPRHVFCATDLHTGRHVYFSHDLIFSPDLGVADPGTISLRRAVQSSANFPGAFPPLRIPRWKFNFHLPAPESDSYRQNLILSDGGIRDNMGVTWFLEAESRQRALSFRLNKFPLETDTHTDSQVNALSEIPEELIVINSSAPYFLKNPGNTWLPILSELNLLFTLPSRMYNNEGVRQVRELREKFFASERELGMKGVVVSIEESPYFLAEYLEEKGNYVLPSYPDEHFDDPLLESLRKELAESQQKANESFARCEEAIVDWKDYVYFEYPDRKLVAPYIRKAATQVMKWLKFGGDYKEVKDRLKAEIEEKRQELRNIEEDISKLEEKNDGGPDYLAELEYLRAKIKLGLDLDRRENELFEYEREESDRHHTFLRKSCF